MHVNNLYLCIYIFLYIRYIISNNFLGKYKFYNFKINLISLQI